MFLNFGENRQFRNPQVWIDNNPIDQSLELTNHPLNHRCIEQIRVVFKVTLKSVFLLRHKHMQIKARYTWIDIQLDLFEVCGLKRGFGKVLQNKTNLKQRILIERALRFQLFNEDLNGSSSLAYPSRQICRVRATASR